MTRIAALLLTLLGATLLLAPSARAEAWLSVERADGQTVVGLLRSQTAEHLVLLVRGLETTVPRSEIVRAAMGIRGEGPAVVLSQPAGSERTIVAGPVEPEPSKEPWLQDPAWPAYLHGRLRVVDRRTGPVGPPALGYPEAGWTRWKRGTHHIVFGGRPTARLSVEEAGAFAGDAELVARVQEGMAGARRDRRGGWALMGIGAGAIAVGAGVAVGSARDQGSGAGIAAGAGIVGAGVISIVAAAALEGSGRRRIASYRARDMAPVMTRGRSWELTQRHNSALRRGLGLPDDEQLDAASTVTEASP